MYKPLADSTLMNMTKKEIIEHLRIAEHNHKVCKEQIEQQYKNCMKLLKEERIKALDECIKVISEADVDIEPSEGILIKAIEKLKE